MDDYVFKSKYSMEEIENNFKEADFFCGIKEGLEEALAYEKGIQKCIFQMDSFMEEHQLN